MARVTIEDISRHTGLSRGTVSRALNDRPDISEQTKQRVLEACRKLNYSPSHAARSLAMGRGFAVAVLIDDLQSVFATSLLRGVLSRAQTARYAVHLAELGGNPERHRESIRAVVSGRIDCVLVAASLSSEVAPLLRETLEERPAVACAPVEGIACDLLVPDQMESGRLVARHLLSNGNRSVLYVHAPERAGAAQRLAGFLEVCRERGLDREEICLELPGVRPITPQVAADLGQRTRAARALAATDDFLAIELSALCLRDGRCPGEDIAVMGQGNERVGARITPTLTTTDFCGEEIGRRAMETMLARLDKTRMDAPQSAHVPPLLIARDSTQSLA